MNLEPEELVWLKGIWVEEGYFDRLPRREVTGNSANVFERKGKEHTRGVSTELVEESRTKNRKGKDGILMGIVFAVKRDPVGIF